jgi:serine protease AprX
MKNRFWRFGAITLAAIGIGVACLGAQATHATDFGSKISDDVWNETANGRDTSFVVVMAQQADLRRAYTMRDQDARGWYVYRTLKAEAARTQASLRTQLDRHGVGYESFWAVNMLVAEGGRSLVEAIAARSDVKAIEADRTYNALEAVPGLEGDEGPDSTDEGNAVEATETGVTNVQGPSLWSLGYTGQGIVVANQDTGMRWTHAALRTHYRGWISGTTADNNYNWHDSIHARIDGSDGGTASSATNSCGYNLLAPCDDQGHGTHTTGTAVGDDAGAGVGTGTNQVGVAPGAKWIGCRNMDAGNGRAATYTECFQFFLAPTNLQNQNPDPSKRPHVMNNSWGCPLSGELCPRTVMQTIVENSDASGIFVEASAGNDGSACNTVQDPPAIYNAAFSTGAISGSTNALQSFSSRGPVTSDGSGRMKPDLVAPGASVRSSLRTSDTSYGTMSGTSMAGPHVVGTVALLWSARPRLVRDTARTKWLLTRSATTSGITVGSNSSGCGGIGSVPNNHYGWGRVQVLAAYNLEPSLNQAIAFPSAGAKTFGDADFTLGAAASSGLAVSYAASGSCTVSGAVVHITGAGSCAVTASQAGLDVYGIAASSPKPWYPAADVTQTIEIAKANQTIDFGALADRTWGDSDFDVSATASSGLPVSFSASGDCSVAASTVHLTGAGSCTVTASQGGNGNYNAAPEVARTFAIAKANQTIAFAPLPNRTVGVDDADFELVATATSGLPVSFAASGACSVAGSTVHVVGVGDCTITASQPGDANFNAAPDVARTFRVAWPYAGFFAPIDNAAVNVAQAGSSVPVKFSLGGSYGFLIFAAGSPASARTTCAVGLPEDPVEQTVTAGQSSLQYDPTTGQYIYVWKTDKAWAGTCRQLSVRLIDTTVHVAYFRFK